jgi:diguanylate cyclase (GGDEF)-like protein
MYFDVDPRPRLSNWVYAVLLLLAATAQSRAFVAMQSPFTALGRMRRSSSETTGQPVTAVRVMGRLGLLYVTAIMTFLSAVLSAFIAWLFSFAIDVPNYNVHIFLAFVIPFFVTPIFSYLSALSMRDLQRARRKAVDLARLDMLTGLGNRRAFFDAARKLAGDPPASHASKGVLYIDIDHFKSINDRYGHEGGDVVLKAFGDLLRSCTRSSDLVARLGGEEFAVHMLDIEPAGLAAVANGVLARVRASEVEFAGNRIRYTVSIGGAIGEGPMSIDRLLSLADTQLYEVKHAGRDGFLLTDARTDARQPAALPEADTRRSAA